MVRWHESSVCRIARMFIGFDSDKACDDCGDARAVVQVMMTHSHRVINLCLACFLALDHASAKHAVAAAQPNATHRTMAAASGIKRESEKLFFSI
jgi:hypothetical protein